MNVYIVNERLCRFQMATGYRGYFVKNQRIFDIQGSYLPQPGSEIFVSGIPSDAFEDELIPFFASIGTVIRFKLMLYNNSIHNRGFATVTYVQPEVADNALKIFKRLPFRSCHLSVEKATENCRLFFGGIPQTKTKDEIWRELIRLGVDGIVDVIMYRSYKDRCLNRGYVFVEFKSYLLAAQARIMNKCLRMWGMRISVDWSEPIPAVSRNIMLKVRKLFLRNIDVTMTRDEFQRLMRIILGDVYLEKIYKFKDYAFLHFRNRYEAQKSLEMLQEYFKNTFVEVCWATPQEYAPRKKRFQMLPSTSYEHPTEAVNYISSSASYNSEEIDQHSYASECATSMDFCSTHITQLLRFLDIE